MKSNELRQLSQEELSLKAAGLRAEISNLKFNKRFAGEKNVNLISLKRHDLARILTIMSEYEKKLSQSK